MKILLMEDDPVLSDIVTEYLREYYRIDHAYDSDEALDLIEKERYDLFIFDINVPGESGIKLLEELRSFNDNTPAIIITAYEDTAHLQEAFDAGAHDYIRKPFALEELKARIENSKRLFRIESDRPVEISPHVHYYPSKATIVHGDTHHTLSPKELRLLDYFLTHPGRLISHEELSHNLWEYDQMPSDATLRSYIRKLREMIGNEKIVTVRGIGYRYE